ncbi:hypothetical protein UG55_1019117 [Frankia sp. EI5c]|uniref:hypothetical protein n=1 Tax=Frankia sp. EI5c TaxID=683316 RepID=UPI0007C2A4E7|nr:hypothetical protein [Frankia sp. EI5c]OAA25915.1 hypothetical protein UG55_1019117 [Frankia sp. EI5c]
MTARDDPAGAGRAGTGPQPAPAPGGSARRRVGIWQMVGDGWDLADGQAARNRAGVSR